MQINIPYKAIVGTGLSKTGGTLKSPLYLSSDPAENLETATKQYIDNKLVSLTSNDIVSGTLSVERFPAFNGDATGLNGTGEINLSNSTADAGDHFKVFVNEKGRITSSTSLSQDDIPSLSWDKITIGRPTKVADYGITDCLVTTGGLATGILTSSATPNQTLHAVTKGYIDSKAANNFALTSGDILRSVTSRTPNGFLRCNGAVIAKSDYSLLYANIGDTYGKSTVPGSGKPWKQQYGLNSANNLDITDWSSTSLPAALSKSVAIVTKNRVYLLGGFITAATANVYTAPINSDGTLGTWTTGTSLPGKLYNSQALITKNRVYLLGGNNDINSTNVIYTAPINADGTLGSWQDNATYVNINLSGSGTYQIGTNVNSITLSGKGGAGSSYYTNGTPGTPDTRTYGWVLTSDVNTGVIQYINPGPGPYSPVPPTTNGATVGETRTSTYYALFDLDEDDYYIHNVTYTWSVTGGSAPTSGTPGYWTNTWGPSTTITINDNTYTFQGGYGGAASLQTQTVALPGDGYSANYSVPSGGSLNIQYIDTNTSGPLGTALPNAIESSQVFITKNKAYLVGGKRGSTILTDVYSSIIDGNGTLGPWSLEPYPLPVGVCSGQVVVINSYAHLLGGITDTGDNYITYTTYINSNSNISSWMNSYGMYSWNAYATIPLGTGRFQAVVTDKYLYLLGGTTSDTGSTYVWRATIKADSSLTSWTRMTDLPVATFNSNVIVTNGKIHLLGGTQSTSSVNTIYSGTFTGGLNDYSPYYDGSLVSADVTKFFLPDYTSKEYENNYYYIKI